MAGPGSGRQLFLDALRGFALIAMVLNHTARWWLERSMGWTRYHLVYVTMAVAAPIFLFLVGFCLPLSYRAAGARGRRAADDRPLALAPDAARAARAPPRVALARARHRSRGLRDVRARPPGAHGVAAAPSGGGRGLVGGDAVLPSIHVNDDLCPDPLSCRKCLLICPTRVLGLGTNVGPEKFKEIDRSHFIVRGVRYPYCTGCMKCVEVCPSGAIQIAFDRGVAA